MQKRHLKKIKKQGWAVGTRHYFLTASASASRRKCQDLLFQVVENERQFHCIKRTVPRDFLPLIFFFSKPLYSVYALTTWTCEFREYLREVRKYLHEIEKGCKFGFVGVELYFYTRVDRFSFFYEF